MNYIVFDLEATCIEDRNVRFQNEIIEIGAVKLNEKLEIVDTFEAFIKPKLNPILSDFCKQLTTIEQKDVDSAKPFYQVLYGFKDWIGKDYLLCSWGKYDKNQFTKDCELHKQDSKWVNKHISLKHQFMENHNIKGRDAGMGSVLKRLGLSLEGTHHRGIDDAKNIAKIFIHEFDKWSLKA